MVVLRLNQCLGNCRSVATQLPEHSMNKRVVGHGLSDHGGVLFSRHKTDAFMYNMCVMQHVINMNKNQDSVVGDVYNAMLGLAEQHSATDDITTIVTLNVLSVLAKHTLPLESRGRIIDAINIELTEIAAKAVD